MLSLPTSSGDRRRRARLLNQGRKCSAPGCTANRYAIARYCNAHQIATSRYGHPEVSVSAWKPAVRLLRKDVGRFIESTDSRIAPVRHAMSLEGAPSGPLADFVRRRLQRPTADRTRPGAGRPPQAPTKRARKAQEVALRRAGRITPAQRTPRPPPSPELIVAQMVARLVWAIENQPQVVEAAEDFAPSNRRHVKAAQRYLAGTAMQAADVLVGTSMVLGIRQKRSFRQAAAAGAVLFKAHGRLLLNLARAVSEHLLAHPDERSRPPRSVVLARIEAQEKRFQASALGQRLAQAERSQRQTAPAKSVTSITVLQPNPINHHDHGNQSDPSPRDEEPLRVTLVRIDR